MTRSLRFQRASAKSAEHVGAMREIEIAEAVVDQPRASREASASQGVVGVEPWFRVLLVGIRAEPGIGRERGRGPFPNAADHLAQARATRQRVVCGRSG